MSPLEMNKKIAGIKRLNWVSSNTTNPALIDHDELPTSDRLHPPKNWAENIADAWELFEEMPYCCVENVNSDLKICSYIPKGKYEDVQWYADTAPMAICLAWLKWKGES